jgi:hypothetical protein
MEYIAEVSTADIFSTHPILILTEQSTPGCDMVLVHDNDLARLDGFGDDTVCISLSVTGFTNIYMPAVTRHSPTRCSGDPLTTLQT